TRLRGRRVHIRRRSASPSSSGLSQRPSSLVTTRESERRVSPSSLNNSTAMPAPGRPCAVSSTWVVSLPIRSFPFDECEKWKGDPIRYASGGSRLHVRGYIPVGDAKRAPCHHSKKSAAAAAHAIGKIRAAA